MIPRAATKSGRFVILSVAITAAAILVSVLQGVFFATQGSLTAYTAVAIGLAATNVIVAIAFHAAYNTRLFGLAAILYCAQLGMFIFALIDSEKPVAPRLVAVAIAVAYLATIMSTLLAGVRIIVPIKAILLSFSLAMGILLSETILDFLSESAPGKPIRSPRWVGTMEPHTTLGAVYRPYSELNTYYPDNPRGYFKEKDIREVKWSLRVAGGSVAKLIFPPKDPDGVRVDIGRAESHAAFDIQLNAPKLKVTAKQRYSLRFRARADRSRRIVAGFARAHEPWTGLGLYKEIELTAQWQDFEIEFETPEDDENARIHFDIGGSTTSVELSSTKLLRLPRGEPIEPNLPFRNYLVSYKFNALGCRARDYQIPHPKGTVRVLLLGDSYTLGVGVHQEDTFASRLETLLNDNAVAQRSAITYEVVNCGVSGYGTREERIFYAVFGAKYAPDTVLLVMAWNDDISFFDEVQKGYINRQRGKLEYLFYTWAIVQDVRHQRPSPDFSKSSQEVLQLNQEIRGNGSRLGVIMFRTDSGKTWKHIMQQVTKGLQGTGVPILDLGAVFLKYPDHDLLVHAVDDHLNDIAHGIAAREILGFLKTENLVR